MKYKVTLNGRTYEVEVEAGQAMLLAEYEAIAPAPVAAAPAAVAAPVAAAPAAPAAPAVTGAGEPVNAPMPGTILKVNVKQGFFRRYRCSSGGHRLRRVIHDQYW